MEGFQMNHPEAFEAIADIIQREIELDAAIIIQCFYRKYRNISSSSDQNDVEIEEPRLNPNRVLERVQVNIESHEWTNSFMNLNIV
jgi:hypothetical protein